MAHRFVSDELWEAVRPLLPEAPCRLKNAGRKRLDDRHVLAGILFVLKRRIPWQDLPKEMGYGSGMTCCRRLHDWKASGIWPLLSAAILAHSNEEAPPDFSRVADSKLLVRTACGKRRCPRAESSSSPLPGSCPDPRKIGEFRAAISGDGSPNGGTPG